MKSYIFMTAAMLYTVCVLLPARCRRAIACATAIAWLLHGLALWTSVCTPDYVRIGFATMLSAALWMSVLAYWLENRNFSVDGLRILMLPWAAIAVALPYLFPGSFISLEDKPVLFMPHVIIAVLAYSVLTIAAFHAVLMTFQEFWLHANVRTARGAWLALALDKLPPLLAMERLLFRMVFWGFSLLTLTVLSGIVFSEALFSVPFQLNHKTIFALLSWLLFGVLLAGRYWLGWRGKMALRFTLAGFITLLLAYVGSRFVFEVILHRGLT